MGLIEDADFLLKHGIDAEEFLAKIVAALRSGPIVRPCPGIISRHFGVKDPIYTNSWKMHLGIDIVALSGIFVVAAKAGTVELVGEAGPLGLTVLIWHPGATRSLYAHLSHIGVTVGEKVAAGTIIGKSGYTGLVDPPGPDGAHLHFETWVQCSGSKGNVFALTRDDPTALPADPYPIWQANRWPIAEEGVHIPGWRPQ